MPDYSKGQIYKIVDVGQTKCYIGSTVQQLCCRMATHRANYKSYLNDKYKYISVFSLFQEFEPENCKIVWVKDYPCSSKKELEAEEGKLQRETDCINKNIAGRTLKEYHNDNKDRISIKQKTYYDNHREERKVYRKEYNEKNKDMKNEYNKKYIKLNEEKRKEKIKCECGAYVLKRVIGQHKKTNKHQQYLQNQTNPQE